MNPPGNQRLHHSIVRSAFVLNSDNLGHRVVTGASFTFLGIALRTLITLGSMAVLARILTPADFGYVAMAAVVTEFAALLGGFGFGNILIQKKTINRLHLDTVFWASAGIGLLVGGAIFLMSFMAGWLFRDSLTGDLLKVMCLSFVFGGLTCVPEAILARLLRFRTEFWIQISVMAARSLVAIAFALMGLGVWSLVVGGIVGSITAVALYTIAVPYLPRYRFHGALLKSTWKTSGSYLGNGLLYYINMNIDLLLIGRSLGATPLGHYQNARSLTDEIRGRIAMPLQRVLFPAFSALQADLGRLQASVIRSGRLLAAIIFPTGIGVAAVANELVPVLYGEQWLEMIPILSLLGISAAVRGSTAIASPLFNSRNQVPLALKFNSISALLTVAAVLIALPHGINAVTFGVMLTSCYSLVTFRMGLGLIELHNKAVFTILGFPAFASAIMWLTIHWVRDYSHDWLSSPIAVLFFHVTLGAVIYALTLHIFSRSYLRDLLEITTKFKAS